MIAPWDVKTGFVWYYLFVLFSVLETLAKLNCCFRAGLSLKNFEAILVILTTLL